MSDVAAAHARTKNALSRALDEGMLSGQVFESASRLISDLRTPLRVVLFGLPQSGKSSVLNLLLGEDVIPEGLDLPTLKVRRGPRPLARLTLADGRVTEHPDYDLEELAGLDAVLIELQLNLPALAKISVLELAMGQSIRGQGRAIAWGSKQCDLALWCSSGFPENEAELWQGVPESLKDKAILVRTKLDELGSRAARQNEIHRLEHQLTDEFSRVLGLSAAEAAAARGAGGAVDKGALRASGGMSVISSVLRHLELSQQHLIDQADVLLVKAGLADVPGYGADDDETVAEEENDGDRGPWLLGDDDEDEGEEFSFDPDPAPEPESHPEPEPEAIDEAAETKSPLFRPKAKPAPAAPAAAVEEVPNVTAMPPQPAPAPQSVPAPQAAVAAQSEEAAGVEAAIGAMVKTAGPLVLTAPVVVPSGPTPPPTSSTPSAAVAAVAEPAPAPAPMAETTSAEPESEPVQKAAPLVLVAETPAPIEISETLRKSLGGAVRRLRSAGASMRAMEPEGILEDAVGTIEWLSERFEDVSDDEPAPVVHLRGQVDEAFDLVQLLQLESAESAAIDAVAVLLQLRRGIEAQLMH